MTGSDSRWVSRYWVLGFYLALRFHCSLNAIQTKDSITNVNLVQILRVKFSAGPSKWCRFSETGFSLSVTQDVRNALNIRPRGGCIRPRGGCSLLVDVDDESMALMNSIIRECDIASKVLRVEKARGDDAWIKVFAPRNAANFRTRQ